MKKQRCLLKDRGVLINTRKHATSKNRLIYNIKNHVFLHFFVVVERTIFFYTCYIL